MYDYSSLTQALEAYLFNMQDSPLSVAGSLRFVMWTPKFRLYQREGPTLGLPPTPWVRTAGATR